MRHFVSRPIYCGFFTAAVIILRWSMTLAMPIIKGPEPINAVEPVGTMVTFTCVVNITELSGIFGAYLWTVGGLTLDGSSNQNVKPNGTLRIGNRQVMALQDYTGGVSVQCEVLTSTSSRHRSNNATLTAYGKIYYYSTKPKILNCMCPFCRSSWGSIKPHINTVQQQCSDIIMECSILSSTATLHCHSVADQH